MPQLCGVDLAIQIKESTLFRTSNVGCLGRHGRAGKRTPRIKDKRRHVDQSAEIYAYARARPTGTNSYCGGWRRIIGHKSTVSSCRSQEISGPQKASCNSLSDTVWDRCGHCLENLLRQLGIGHAACKDHSADQSREAGHDDGNEHVGIPAV